MRVDDVIVEANGISGDSRKMLSALKTCSEMEIRLESFRVGQLWGASAGFYRWGSAEAIPMSGTRVARNSALKGGGHVECGGPTSCAAGL